MNIRNCIEADVLKVLGGTDLQCQGTQIEILTDIVTIMGGTATQKDSRNDLFEVILATT